MQGYGRGSASSREKDLVDLLVISNYERVDLIELQEAIEAERLLRGMELMESFEIPSQWGPPFKKLATRTPACEGIVEVEDAVIRVKAMVEPALLSTPAYQGTVWLPSRGWTRPEELEVTERTNRPAHNDDPGLEYQMRQHQQNTTVYHRPGFDSPAI